MDDDLSPDLARLLDRYDEQRRAVEERMRQAKADEQRFQRGFTDLSAGVVRPVFEAIGAVLKARGHDFRICEDGRAVEPGGDSTESAISIHVMLAGMPKAAQDHARDPSLSFVTRSYNKSVCIIASNAPQRPSGAAGSRGDYQLAQIDATLVRTEAMKLIAGIVGAA